MAENCTWPTFAPLPRMKGVAAITARRFHRGDEVGDFIKSGEKRAFNQKSVGRGQPAVWREIGSYTTTSPPPSPFGAVAEQIFAFYPAPLPRRMIFLLRPPFLSRPRKKEREGERNGKGNNRLRPPPLRSCDRFLLFKYRDYEFTFFVGPSEGGRERRNLRDFPSYTMLCRSLLLRSAIGALADEDVRGRHWLSHYKFRGHNTPSSRFGCPFFLPAVA